MPTTFKWAVVQSTGAAGTPGQNINLSQIGAYSTGKVSSFALAPRRPLVVYAGPVASSSKELFAVTARSLLFLAVVR